MSLNSNLKAKHLILGALVADAAAMGSHWIYDQARIKKIAPGNPEFHQPSADDYLDVPGYFAHPNRLPGDSSHYGYQALAMLRSLHATKGKFDVGHYSKTFRSMFGYGGDYVGYIDHSTRKTLDNFTRSEDEALKKARKIPFDGDVSITNALVVKTLALVSQFSGDELLQQFENAVRVTHDDEDVLAHGYKILEQVKSASPAFGAVDEQFPATSKLAALIGITKACTTASETEISTMAEQAIRVTSDHERAFSYGKVCATMMMAAVDGDTIGNIIERGTASGTPEIKSAITKALSMKDSSVEAVTQEFGMACDLRYGVPSVIYNLSTCSSYSEAIRRNIYSGGDSCGRSMILGAVLGAAYGVGGEEGIPEQWIEKLAIGQDVLALLDAL